MCSAHVEHSTYEQLHAAVLKACPKGFVCREPLALFHEVLWSSGVILVKETGENARVRLERDELRHAIEEGEYEVLWGSEKSATNSPLSICVDVVEEGGDVPRGGGCGVTEVMPSVS
jgi:hypothetical protein